MRDHLRKLQRLWIGIAARKCEELQLAMSANGINDIPDRFCYLLRGFEILQQAPARLEACMGPIVDF